MPRRNSVHRALALLRSEKYSRTKGAPCVKTLHFEILETHLWAHKWRKRSSVDQDIWCYITMHWPTHSQEDKQRIFEAVMDRAYQTYVAPIDRFIIVNKQNKRKNI